MRYTTCVAAVILSAIAFSQRPAADDTAKDSARQNNHSSAGSSEMPLKGDEHSPSHLYNDAKKTLSSAAVRQKQIDLKKENEKKLEEKYTLDVIELTNRARVKAGLTPLRSQANLGRSAAWLARDMADNKYFSHTDSKGRSINPRLPDFGYTDYAMIGENIAAGQDTPAAVVAGWMKSPGHRANILMPEFREIGVAYYAKPGTKFRKYWVQDFGTPASSRD